MQVTLVFLPKQVKYNIITAVQYFGHQVTNGFQIKI